MGINYTSSAVDFTLLPLVHVPDILTVLCWALTPYILDSDALRPSMLFFSALLLASFKFHFFI